MSTVASRDLRNHTAEVLRKVAEGTDVTITVHGRPVALLTRPRSTRATHLKRGDLLAHLAAEPFDPDFHEDLQWISAGSTDDLDPLP